MADENEMPPVGYDPTKLRLLDGLDPIRERGPTIINDANLSAEEVQRLCLALAANKELWQIEILDKHLRKTVIFRGQMPPSRLLR